MADAYANMVLAQGRLTTAQSRRAEEARINKKATRNAYIGLAGKLGVEGLKLNRKFLNDRMLGEKTTKGLKVWNKKTGGTFGEVLRRSLLPNESDYEMSYAAKQEIGAEMGEFSAGIRDTASIGSENVEKFIGRSKNPVQDSFKPKASPFSQNINDEAISKSKLGLSTRRNAPGLGLKAKDVMPKFEPKIASDVLSKAPKVPDVVGQSGFFNNLGSAGSALSIGSDLLGAATNKGKTNTETYNKLGSAAFTTGTLAADAVLPGSGVLMRWGKRAIDFFGKR